MPSIGVLAGPPLWEAVMHYPHRTSRIKRKRSIGFRARMKTTDGRKMMNRKRAAGRSLNIADKHL
jgi:large subunit ribosomal protein L34